MFCIKLKVFKALVINQSSKKHKIYKKEKRFLKEPTIIKSIVKFIISFFCLLNIRVAHLYLK